MPKSHINYSVSIGLLPVPRRKILKAQVLLTAFITFALLAVGGSAHPALAETMYWVSPTGTAAWVSCNSQTPLSGPAACALATANSNAGAGDIVYLRAGTYNQGIAPAQSGSSTSRLTYRGYSGETAKITGVARGINVVGKSYITIDGVNVDGVDTFADLQNAHHIWILNSTLINSTDTGGWPLGIKIYNNSQYNRLANCTIGHVGYMTSDDDIGGVMNLGDWANPNDTTAYNLIENNHFYHGGHHIIEIASKYNILRNNTFHNENWTPCSRSSTGNLCGNRDVVIADDSLDAYWNVLEGNRFAFAGASIDDTTGSTGASVRNPHTIVRNNLFYFNDGPGLGLYVDWTTTYDARYSHVYNNVFYQNAISPLSASDYRYTFGMVFDNVAGNGAPLPITDVAVKNNVFYKNAGGDIFFYYTDPSLQTVLGNYYSLASGSNASGYFTPNIPSGNVKSSGDPLFVDISATATVANIDKFDFHLQAASPLIDKGVFLTSTTSAGSGTVIPVVDAGYFIDGYGIVPGDTIQFQGQTQTARITSVDYTNNRLTVDTPLTWTLGLGVSMPYNGSAPEVGAYEYADAADTTPPGAPTGLSVN